ncbi:MAG TPA: glycosyltransferase [Pseudolabrys sp.]|nr:glycosyltransferase [Pseudolabrys sp.]
MSLIIAALCIGLWVYLLLARGRFWLGPRRDAARPRPPRKWPAVTAIIPARNEAGVIAESLSSLCRQEYPGPLMIIVVDDDSKDDTAEIVAESARSFPDRHVEVLKSPGPPAGWTGKLWALQTGIAFAGAEVPETEYLLLTDADIVHAPDTLAWLVSQAGAGGYGLTSLMAKLRCESLAERSHVPAFIYFFQMLFPFCWVRQTRSKTAAAAGGCMLVDADALRRAGGIASVRNALIDDCSLAARLKAVGPIWLGLTGRVESIRPYDTFADVRQMIARSAYAQLRYSPLLLVATIAGMTFTFLAGPLLAVLGSGAAQILGIAVWLAMAFSFQPTLRFYRLSPLWGFALPLIASLYSFYTVLSAFQHFARRGGAWKGRVHVNAASAS